MKWKTTLVVFLATVAFGAYISLYELKAPSPAQRAALAARVLELPADTVTSIVLTRPESAVTLARETSGWRLSSPHVRADDGVVDQLLYQVTGLAAQRALAGTPEEPLDQAALGLEPPAVEIRLGTGATQTVVRIGEATALGTSRYLQVAGRPEVFVVSPELFATATRPADAFRDPLLIRFSSWLAERLALASPETSFTLERRDTQWHLTEPLEDLAAQAEVGALLSELGDIRIQQFVDDAPDPQRLSAAGLDAPRMEVRLALGEGATTVLRVGGPVPQEESLVYAHRDDEASLYAVEADAVEALARDPHALRAKTCFDFFTSQVAKVEQRWQQATWSVARREGEWRAEDSDEALEPAAVEAFLHKLADLRLSGFEDDAPDDLTRYGLEPPAGTITVWIEEVEEPQRLLIGKTLESSTSRYAYLAARRTVVRLPDDVLELLETTPEQFVPAEEPTR